MPTIFNKKHQQNFPIPPEEAEKIHLRRNHGNEMIISQHILLSLAMEILRIVHQFIISTPTQTTP